MRQTLLARLKARRHNRQPLLHTHILRCGGAQLLLKFSYSHLGAVGKGKDVPADYRDSLLRPVPWLDSFDIDGDVLDVEHKWLIEAFNHACQQTAQSASLGRKAVAELDVIGLLAAHFANEEQLFDSLDYPDSALHRREHDHIRWLSTPLMTAIDDHSFAHSLIQSRTFLVEHLIRHDLGFKSHLLHRDGK